jgi:glycosyltransferase involved in cell wall biosynthesis
MGDRARLNTFGTVIANSRFTAGWIARRWGRHAAVLHPPVRSVTPLAKRPYILAVGRFTGGGRSKRQEEMVRMFRRLTERGLRDWELHLAGFAHDRAFLDRIRADAAGLPVHVHRDLSRPALDELYGYSSVFWHATGVGVDPDREPERM